MAHVVMEQRACQSTASRDIGTAPEGAPVKVAFKLTADLLHRTREQLVLPHPFAAERVGFLSCRVGAVKPSGWLVLAHDFHPVEDNDYLEDFSVGAMMGPTAIRKAMQFAFNNEVAMFHVHMHGHRGQPWFSGTDLRENANFIPDFWHVRPHSVHGALVLSKDSLAGMCWHPQSPRPLRFNDFSIVGSPMSLLRRAR